VERLRLVLDTNVLVSGIASPAGIPGRILALWLEGAVEIALSRYILDETVRVLPRLSKLNFTAEQAHRLAERIALTAEMIKPDNLTEPDLRDPADQQILATFIAANADYLLAGDKDLLALATRYPILTPAEFWSRHG
jgi:putative PIN family toxin of toxin-antitoxin system